MINSISLSEDQKSLFLIDAERVIKFDLTAPEGVIIGKLQGQLCAVTAPNIGFNSSREEKTDSVFITVKSNDQVTLIYNRSTAALGLIGTLDIVQTITEPNKPPTPPTGNCDLNLFSLDDYDVHILRRGDTLVFTRLDK